MPDAKICFLWSSDLLSLFHIFNAYRALSIAALSRAFHHIKVAYAQVQVAYLVFNSISRFSRLFPEAASMKVLISQRSGCQSKHHTAVRTNNGLTVFPVSTEIFQITAAPDRLHQRIEHHHCFGTNSISIFVDRTAISTCIFIADLLAVSTIMFCVAASEKARNFNIPRSYLCSRFTSLIIPESDVQICCTDHIKNK